MAHTHRPVVDRLPDGRAYLNPGAFLEAGVTTIITPDGVELQQFHNGADFHVLELLAQEHRTTICESAARRPIPQAVIMRSPFDNRSSRSSPAPRPSPSLPPSRPVFTSGPMKRASSGLSKDSECIPARGRPPSPASAARWYSRAISSAAGCSNHPFLDERYEQRTGLAVDPARPARSALIARSLGARSRSCLAGADHADRPRLGRRDRRAGTGLDHADDRYREETLFQVGERMRGARVAGDDHRLHPRCSRYARIVTHCSVGTVSGDLEPYGERGGVPEK